MNEQDLDALYTQLCHTMTHLGEAQTPLFLARFALLAMQQVADRAQVQRMIEAAAADLGAWAAEGGAAKRAKTEYRLGAPTSPG